MHDEWNNVQKTLEVLSFPTEDSKEGEQLKKYVGIEQVKFHRIVDFSNYVLNNVKNDF